MFTLTLLRFTPVSKESHLIAVVVAFVGYLVDSITVPSASATSSFTTALIAAACWYTYKVFDGVTYDGVETPYTSMLGIALAVGICASYFAL